MFGGGRAPLTVLGFGILAGVYLGIRLRRDEHGGYLFFYKSPYRQFFSLVIIASVFVASTPEMAYAGTPVYDNPIFYYYHSDHLGSSSIMTDADGDLVQHYGYMPFGDERYSENGDAFSVSNRYTSQILDEETGLYFYGSRYYDPELARFIQPDSVVPAYNTSQVLNRYTYCNNNPLLFTDPSGHIFGIDDVIFWSIIIGAGVGGGIAAAQGGNFWMGALAGGIAGAFGGYGWSTYGADNLVGVAACTAAGGALGALVTGGDPGMAAATAAIVTVAIAGISNYLDSRPTAAGNGDSVQAQDIKAKSASKGEPEAGGTKVEVKKTDQWFHNDGVALYNGKAKAGINPNTGRATVSGKDFENWGQDFTYYAETNTPTELKQAMNQLNTIDNIPKDIYTIFHGDKEGQMFWDNGYGQTKFTNSELEDIIKAAPKGSRVHLTVCSYAAGDKGISALQNLAKVSGKIVTAYDGPLNPGIFGWRENWWINGNLHVATPIINNEGTVTSATVENVGQKYPREYFKK